MCRVSIMLIASLMVLLPGTHAVFPCNSDADCVQSIHSLSTCQNDQKTGSFCTNPYSSGCLRQRLGEEQVPKKRTCNSDDRYSQDCTPPELNYREIRVYAGNWESSIFNAFLLQIFLSELLGVPVTIESGDERYLSFYDPKNDFPFPYASTGYFWDEMKLLNDQKDKNGKPTADCAPLVAKGKVCGHVMPEVWTGQEKKLNEAVRDGYIEHSEGVGMIGSPGWFTPKFAAQRDAGLTTYFGLQGEENRIKLLDLLRTPTNWQQYCTEISTTNCTEEDDFAKRAPTPDELEQDQGTRFFVPEVYTGFFREVDCDRNDTNCTGNIVDYPCTWSTYLTQQAYWNDIRLESKGPEAPSGGYDYRDMLDIWNAANATQSPVIMRWWRPEANVQGFQGTSAEFIPVTLPVPTELCRKNRIDNEDRCSEDIWKRRGKPEGACGDEIGVLRRVIVQALGDYTFAQKAGTRSPAYEAIKNLRISDLSIDAMLRSWLSRDLDTYGFDPREAVCAWAADNIDEITQAIPRGYPREVLENEWYGPLIYATSAIAAVMVITVFATGFITYKYRSKRAFRIAQLDFLAIILSGILLFAVGGIAYGLVPTMGVCIAQSWLLTLGFTLSIVPLLVKVAAINKINQGAKKLKRIKLTRKQLFGEVAVVVALVLVYLIVWTTVDPLTRQESVFLKDEQGNQVERLVFCSSSSDVWIYIVLAWNFVLLICATVLAIQSRNVRQEFNESKNLGILVYAHFFFWILFTIVYLLAASNAIDPNVFSGISSLLLSLDVGAAIGIYFVPKFVAKDTGNELRVSGLRSDFSEQGQNRSALSWDFVVHPHEKSSSFVDKSGELLPHQTPHDTAPDFILGEVSPLPDSTGNGEDDQG